MTELLFESLNEALVDALPELREAYERELAWWDPETPPGHVLYATILKPALQEALTRPTAHEDFLSRAFAFVERLAAHADPRVREVAALSVLEALEDRPQLLAKARGRMGPASLNMLSEMEG